MCWRGDDSASGAGGRVGRGARGKGGGGGGETGALLHSLSANGRSPPASVQKHDSVLPIALRQCLDDVADDIAAPTLERAI
eukprot:COSAG03_NODE_337_length_8860_cov_33.996690_1_plen_81_part_00